MTKKEKILKSGNIELDIESNQNAIGFFELLLKVDKRINPDLYKGSNQLNKGNKDD